MVAGVVGESVQAPDRLPANGGSEGVPVREPRSQANDSRRLGARSKWKASGRRGRSDRSAGGARPPGSEPSRRG